ncbi:unnamed protein product [Psylliodes chrysocephalus]|uniref:Uncharacterized protein n=1 Tax=Psylliodes chrysocephalus TaxID=3402493 RepID=A0A9P0CGY5_9CUCU|nr:unnamed protein product [Psylliodes chrysocephala]
MAEVVIREKHRFGLSDNIIGISFHTTSSNTGLIQGACTRIERELGQTLLCLTSVVTYHQVVLKSRSFESSINMWASLDKKSYTTKLDKIRPVQGFIEEQRVKMINYLQNVLKDGSHPREDYKELLQLSLLYLGGWSQDEFSFRIPGDLHQARWMEKAIFALKIVLFAKQ